MKGVTSILIALVGIFSACTALHKSNDLAIKLYPAKGHSSTLGTTYSLTIPILPNSTQQAFAKTLNLDTFIVSKYSYYPEQYYYQKWKNKEIDSLTFIDRLNQYNIDTSRLSSTVTFNTESLFLSGKTASGDFVIVADANNDNLLSNDAVYILKDWFNGNTITSLDSFPHVVINNLKGEYNGQKQVFSQALIVKPLIKDSKVHVTGNSISEMSILVMSENYSTGKFRYKGEKYKVAVRNILPKMLYDSRNTLIKFANRREDTAFKKKYNARELNSIGDTLLLGKNIFTVKGISPFGRYLYLQPLSIDFNLIKRDVIGDFAFIDFKSQQTIQLKQLFEENRYTVIDFWGSWCVPCIASFPNLIQLRNSLMQKKVGFLGVVYDDENSKDKVRSILAKQQVNWNQLFISRNTTHSLISQYKIDAFPTYIIVDATGKIIYRGVGEDGLSAVSTFLNQN